MTEPKEISGLFKCSVSFVAEPVATSWSVTGRRSTSSQESSYVATPQVAGQWDLLLPKCDYMIVLLHREACRMLIVNCPRKLRQRLTKRSNIRPGYLAPLRCVG